MKPVAWVCGGWEDHTDRSMRLSDALVDANEEGARIGNPVLKIWVVHIIGGYNSSSLLNCAARSTSQGHVTARVNKYPNINEASLRTQFPHNVSLDCP